MEKSLAYKKLRNEVKDLIPKGWKGLRYIQEQSIISILGGNKDIIIFAPTSSGKTEAAFLPTINETYDDIKKEVKILYISPLIALINDQYERLNNFLNQYNDQKIKVTKWHSEVSESIKRNFLRDSRGILIITPESLESLLVRNKGSEIFKNIEYYIIDEFHDFLGGIRGDQLRSILSRIDRITIKTPIKILLSATLNDENNSCAKWLNKISQNIDSIQPPSIKQKKPEGRMHYYSDKKKYYETLKNITEEKKHLIFGNSKASLEISLHRFKEFLKLQNLQNKLLEIHHGSLNKKLKNKVEKNLHKSENMSVFCTSTLEMGIDIKDISQVSLIAPPFSVASFIQRIGRSGRREDANIKFNLLPHMLQDYSPFYPELKAQLVQSIALFELYKEKWVEPKEFQTFTYSVCAHQMLAFTAQRQSVTKKELRSCIVEPNFTKEGISVSEEDFDQMIENFIEKNYLFSTNIGSLALGKKGRRLIKQRDFYSVFLSEPCWKLKNYKDENFIGTVSRLQKFQLKDTLLFAGDYWEVVSTHSRKNLIYLKKTNHFKKLPKFCSSGMGIHKKVHQKMRKIYETNTAYDYLNEEGALTLTQARIEYSKLTTDKDSDFIPLFMGSQIAKFICHLLKQEGDTESFETVASIGLHSTHINEDRMKSFLKNDFFSREQVEKFVQKLPIEDLWLEKWDNLLPESILRRSYIDHKMCFDDYQEYILSESITKYKKIA